MPKCGKLMNQRAPPWISLVIPSSLDPGKPGRQSQPKGICRRSKRKENSALTGKGEGSLRRQKPARGVPGRRSAIDARRNRDGGNANVLRNEKWVSFVERVPQPDPWFIAAR